MWRMEFAMVPAGAPAILLRSHADSSGVGFTVALASPTVEKVDSTQVLVAQPSAAAELCGFVGHAYATDSTTIAKPTQLRRGGWLCYHLFRRLFSPRYKNSNCPAYETRVVAA